MRRLLSLVLLAAFGFPAVAPVLALGQDTESSLPACCRRNGAHHCSMGNMQRQSTSAPALSEHCPCFPQPSISPSQLNSFALVSAPRLSHSHNDLPLLVHSSSMRCTANLHTRLRALQARPSFLSSLIASDQHLVHAQHEQRLQGLAFHCTCWLQSFLLSPTSRSALMRRLLFCCLLFVALTAAAQTGIFGSVHGIVHDPQHRPVANAHIALRAAHSALVFTTLSNSEGAFSIPSVPLGDYSP